MAPKKTEVDFLPANESKLYIFFFKWYCRWLFARRFHRVWIRQEYNPDGRNTLYILNHNSWWDGLTPLLLNEFRFGQNARAIMEDRQIRKFPFFTRIGAMSISRENMRSALATLAAASQWLKSSNNSLFLYPEGKITNPCEPIRFEGGLMRILKKSPECDIVPIALHISVAEADRPELFIHVGTEIDRNENYTLISFQNHLQDMLNKARSQSLQKDRQYDRLI
jgi:1-acyl-sn-glycerol-3-phosphate acyltransferase